MRLPQFLALTILCLISAAGGVQGIKPFRGGSISSTLPNPNPGAIGNPNTNNADPSSNLKSLLLRKSNEPENRSRDSVDAFALDVTRVLKDLRAHKYDPTVNSMFHSESRPTFAVTWTHKMWEVHTSRMRFINQFLYWHKSALLKRVMPQLTVLMIWSTFVIHGMPNMRFDDVKFPMSSLSLVSGFVGTLLALRTNQGMSRLLEARQAFGKVVLYTRDMASMVSNFVYDKDPDLAIKLARHLTIFSWLLKNFLQGRAACGTDEDLIRTMLPSTADADYVLHQRKMPVAVVIRLRQALAHCTHKHMLSTAEEIAIDHGISAMDSAIMITERIVASPIPPLFTTHAGRLMCFYLGFLPIALKNSGSMNNSGMLLTILVVGYAMLGLDEISHLMEQPFKVCPLYHLCKNSMRDVADAFCLKPPPLQDADQKEKTYQLVTPPYWTAEKGLESERMELITDTK